MSGYNLNDLTALETVGALFDYLQHTPKDTILNDMYNCKLVEGGDYHTEKLSQLKERGIVWMWWYMDLWTRRNLMNAVERHAAKRLEWQRAQAAAEQHELNLNTEYCDTP